MSELPSELSTRVGIQVENNFAVILQRLHIVFEPNKVLKRVDGQWKEAPELEVFFAQRRIIADALHEFSSSHDEFLRTRAREVANVARYDYSDYLLGKVRAARNHHRNQNLERSVMESPPPCHEDVLEIDFVIRPQSLNRARDDLPEIPVCMMKPDPSGTFMVNWHDIVEQCRSGAFIEVTSAGWERHGKLQSTRLPKMHEAREQWFRAGHILYFYNGYSGNLAGISNPAICLYWYCKDDVLNVEKKMLESDNKKLEAENKALRSQGATETQIKPVWVRQLQKEDGEIKEADTDPFQVKSDLSNVDDLKEAIKGKKPNRVKCDADEIEVRSLKDGRWEKEDADAEINRGTSMSDCYGFLLPD